MKSFTIQCLSETLSPMTHMQGVAGNQAIIAREPVVTDRGLVWVPYLSGNAMRHRAIREPGMLWLIDQYDLRGKLSLEQLNCLLHGGNLSESNAHENTKRIAEMHRTWPLLRLVGCSLPNQIIPGCIDAWRGMLVCEENRQTLAALFPGIPRERLFSAERFIGEYQYTRGDAGKRAIHSQAETALEPQTNLMIFAGQCVQRGAMFHHGFVLKHVSEIEVGALLWSLRLWQAEGGTLGGSAAKGHGRLQCRILCDGIDQDAACRQYVEHAMAMKDDATAWLTGAWK